jgi:hypothetical protein
MVTKVLKITKSGLSRRLAETTIQLNKKPLGGSHAERVNHRRYRVLLGVAISSLGDRGTF